MEVIEVIQVIDSTQVIDSLQIIHVIQVIMCAVQDNICNVDSLRLLQSPLPLPLPRAMLWKNTQHVIDDLHIANRVSQKKTFLKLSLALLTTHAIGL